MGKLIGSCWVGYKEPSWSLIARSCQLDASQYHTTRLHTSFCHLSTWRLAFSHSLSSLPWLALERREPARLAFCTVVKASLTLVNSLPPLPQSRSSLTSRILDPFKYFPRITKELTRATNQTLFTAHNISDTLFLCRRGPKGQYHEGNILLFKHCNGHCRYQTVGYDDTCHE